MKRLDFFGRVDEAYRCSEEVVELFRRLQTAENVFQPDLYFAIVSRTALLIHTKQEEACGNLAKEALDSMALFEQRYGADEEFLTCQSRLHHNLSRSHALAKRYEEALEHVRKAIELCRRLPPSDTYDGSKDLPLFTLNLCGDLNALGHTKKAIAVGEQAVSQLRELVQRYPAYKMYLSNALIKLSRCYNSLEQAGPAISKLLEALSLGQELVDSQPALQFELASLWHLYSTQIDQAGHRPQAVEAIQESIKLYRGINNPSSIQLEGLGAALSALSFLLPSRDPKRRDALTESIRVYRNLQSYSLNQVSVQKKLAHLLLVRCEQLTEHEYLDDDGGVEELGVLMKEAMDIYRILAKQDFRLKPKLALSLFKLSTKCCGSSVWDWKISLDWLRESVDLYRDLMAQNPEHKPAFLQALLELGHCLDWHGQSAPVFEELRAYTNAESETEVQHAGEESSECTKSDPASEVCREQSLLALKGPISSDSMSEAGENSFTPEQLVHPDSGVPRGSRGALELLTTLHAPTNLPERLMQHQLILG